MTELVFGSICFAAGVVVAVLVPKVYNFAAAAIAKAKAAASRDDGKE
jgi:hypothetical protein